MDSSNRPPDGRTDVELEEALQHLRKAEGDLARAHAEEQRAEHEIAEAIEEIEHARDHHRPRLVEVTVDRVKHEVPPGNYVVTAFKALVSVASDRELDELKAGMLQPLNDVASIAIHGCEIFVSHVRTGSSA